MTYQLDFAHLTIGDLVGITSNNQSTADWILFADKVIVGGVGHLPASELMAVLTLVAPATRLMLEQLAGVGSGGMVGVWKVAE